MKRGGLIGGALVLGAVPALAADKSEPVVLPPASPWHVQYADDSCRLAREFGTGEAAVTLMIDQFEPGDMFRMSLIGGRMKRPAGLDEARVRFGAALPEQAVPFYPSMVGKYPAWSFAQDMRVRPLSDAETAARAVQEDAPLAPISEEEKASVTAIDIGRPLRRPLRLHTGSMKASFAAMDACTDELLTHWGIDVVRHKTRSRPVTPADSPGIWLKSEDYPSAMQQMGQPGIVQFRLTVDEKGIPAACHIQQSTNPEGFDRTVCEKLMRRARFVPALDKDGKPMTSYYRDTVHFMFPN
jgi:TonB family protein